MAEVYPYSDPIKRQAIGITSEEAYTVIFSGPAPASDAQILMGGVIFRIVSIAPYEPLQAIIASTGKRVCDG